MNFIEAMKLCDAGLDAWKSKPHNAQWWRRIDGTPIPNDLLCNIAEKFVAALADQAEAGEDHRESPTLEQAYAREAKAKFGTDDIVRHAKGGKYLIIMHALIEATGQNSYVYRDEDGCVWVRPVAEMEDGRFTRIGSYPNVNGFVRMELANLLDHFDGLPNDVKLGDDLTAVKTCVDRINQAIEFDKFPDKAIYTPPPTVGQSLARPTPAAERK